MRTCVLTVATLSTVSKMTIKVITFRIIGNSQMFMLKVLSYNNSNRRAVAIRSQSC